MVYDIHEEEEPPAPIEAPEGSRNVMELVTLQPVKYTKGDVSLARGTEVTAEVEIRATSSTTVREGLDLVMVLDIGDNMAGARLEELKKAIRFVLMKLTPVDRLSIITFSNETQMRCPLRSMTQAAKDNLRKDIVDTLKASGGEPNVMTAIKTGLEVMKSRKHGIGRTPNIFLVTAGPCVGAVAGKFIRHLDVDNPDVSVYTFGLGGNGEGASKTSHNQLLSRISLRSVGGTFNWMPDGTSLSAAFSQPLVGLLTVVAQDVEVLLTARTDDVYKMELPDEAYYLKTTNTSDGGIRVVFGNLSSGESRKVTVKFEVSDDAPATRYDAELAYVQHSYTAQGTSRGLQAPQVMLIKRTLTPTGTEGSSSSRERLLRADQACRLHTISFFRKWRPYFVEHLLENWSLHSARYELVAAQNELEDGMEIAVAMQLRAELRSLLARVLLRSPEAYRANGVPYVLASMSSHVKQRFAARGHDTGVIRLYSTPRMDIYLQQARQFDEDPNTPLQSADEDAKNEGAFKANKP